MLGVLNDVLKPHLLQRKSQLKLYNILFVPSLLYGCAIWSLKQRDVRRWKDSRDGIHEMHSRIQLLDHRRNEGVLEELKVDPAERTLTQYKQKWWNHVSRMEDKDLDSHWSFEQIGWFLVTARMVFHESSGSQRVLQHTDVVEV